MGLSLANILAKIRISIIATLLAVPKRQCCANDISLLVLDIIMTTPTGLCALTLNYCSYNCNASKGIMATGFTFHH